MKSLIYSLIKLLITIIILQDTCFAQIIIDTSPTRSIIISCGINPNDQIQVVDSLSTKDDHLRWNLIQFVGNKKIYQAIPKLKLLFQQPNTKRFPNYRRMEQRATILRTVMELKDTTFREEFKQELDSLSLNDENYEEIMKFSSYLQDKHNDCYGWQYMKKFYLPEYPGITTIPFFRAPVYYLKPLLDSIYRDEVVEILRNRAASDDIALDYLAEINDPETETLALSLSANGSNNFIRSDAREVLKNINIDTYIFALKVALNTETESRYSIYQGLLRTKRPGVYKYVVDLYKTNQYPADSTWIILELTNPYLLSPKKDETVAELIDSLVTYLNQLHSFDWIRNQNFVQELNTYLVNSRSYYQSGDTIAAIAQLKLFSKLFDHEFRDSTDLVYKYVNNDAWNFLYPQALFIQKKMGKKSLADSLIGLTPSSIQVGSNDFTLSIKGTGFNSQAGVFWNGSPLTTFVVSDTVLEARVPSSNVSVVDDSITINVFNPISKIKNKLTFKVTPELPANPNLMVKLKNSLGNQIPASNVKYYEGSWKDAVNNGDGTFTVITTKPTVSIRVFYEYASQQVDNVPAQNNTYTFTTVNAAVQLKNSLFNLIDAGTVQYYAGAWRSFGTTSNGVAYKELLPINYSFRMTYEYGSIDKQQNLSVDPTIVFQTVNAAVQLKNSLGNLIDAGTVQYYAGAWRSFGTTSNGVAYKELLPINYSFRMAYEYVSKDKQQNLSINPVVDFSTVLCSVKVSKTSNNQPINNANVKYYSGAWRNLGTTNATGIATKELLPANISFRATLGSVSLDKQQDISVNNLVEILLNIP